MYDDYGIIGRLIFGGSPAPSEEILRLLGFVHLYSSSGIHLYAFLRTIERALLFGARSLGLQATRIKGVQFWVGTLLLFYVWSLQSFRVGFARPMMIFLIRSWVSKRGVRWRVLYPLLICLFFDLFFLHSFGRAHYYLAVAGGLVALDWVRGGWLTEHFAMAVGSFIFTSPLDLIEHHVISWMTPVWSMVTLPIISGVLYPWTLMEWFCSHSFSPSLLQCWNRLMEGCLWIVNQGFAFSVVGDRTLWMACVFAVILSWISKGSFRIYAFLIFVVILSGLRWVQPQFLSPPQLVQFNVGQGDSLWVHHHRTEMIDVGGSHGIRSVDWIYRLAKYESTSIDTILLSHLDQDHVGGLPLILPFVPVESIETAPTHWKSDRGKILSQNLSVSFSNIKRCDHDCFRSGQVQWFSSNQSHGQGNDWMSGVVIPLSENSVYLALGDGDSSQEDAFLKWGASLWEKDRYRIWKVSHHGSRFSSDEGFLQKLHPNQSWISVGKHNPYHHPTWVALNHLHQVKTEVHRTDEEGDLEFREPIFSSLFR